MANKAFERFEYSARFEFRVKECGCFRRNRPQTAYKYLSAHARFILTQTRARGEPVIPMRGRPDGSGQFAIEIPDYERTKKCGMKLRVTPLSGLYSRIFIRSFGGAISHRMARFVPTENNLDFLVQRVHTPMQSGTFTCSPPISN